MVKHSITLTKHARQMMEVRNIKEIWLDQTLQNPEHESLDVNDKSLNLAFRKIAEFDNRWLRVVYRKTDNEIKVITAFFDRGMEKQK